MNKVFTKCKMIIAEQSFVHDKQALIANVTVESRVSRVQYQSWSTILTMTPNALYRSLKAVPGVHSVRIEIVAEV